MTNHPIAELALEFQDYMVAQRRHLHRSPELSFEERLTSNHVRAELDRLQIPYEVAGDYGVVATIEGQNAERMVALRADMDALPIQEINTHLEYCSQHAGVMHACGHDGHVAMLLGAAQMLVKMRDQIPGTVKLCFQQAEERGGGTAEILKLLAPHPVRGAFAIHLWSEIETGKFSVQAGPRMAAGDNFDIHIEGLGCHGATPQRGIDPIVVAAAIVNGASHLISREIDPTHAAALTFGKLHSGNAGNVIPQSAALAGTLRTTDKNDQVQLQAALRRVVEHTAQAHRAHATIDIRRGGTMLVNDARESERAHAVVQSLYGAEALISFPSLMVSENFGDFLEVYPGLMAFIGVRNEACGATFAHHHPQFNIDEAVLHQGAALHVGYAVNCLAAA
ncbi:MAG: amidohydrolase [Burkholderiaceae bacterium]|nr:amidohydrolase [Burkholderiaceae bacterium]